jgi:hypothetical protein
MGVINTLSDPASTCEHILRVVCEHAARKRNEADAAGFKVILRDRETNLQETLAIVEKHCGLT